QLEQLGLELQIDPAGPVDDLDQRLRRQGLELRRQGLCPLAQRTAGVQVCEYLLQLAGLCPQRGVTRLRLLGHALETPLDVVAVGDEELELEPLEVTLGIRALGVAGNHGE